MTKRAENGLTNDHDEIIPLPKFSEKSDVTTFQVGGFILA